MTAVPTLHSVSSFLPFHSNQGSCFRTLNEPSRVACLWNRTQPLHFILPPTLRSTALTRPTFSFFSVTRKHSPVMVKRRRYEGDPTYSPPSESTSVAIDSVAVSRSKELYPDNASLFPSGNSSSACGLIVPEPAIVTRKRNRVRGPSQSSVMRRSPRLSQLEELKVVELRQPAFPFDIGPAPPPETRNETEPYRLDQVVVEKQRCAHCPKMFGSFEQRKRHESKFHTIGRGELIECKLCHEMFKNESNLRRHEEIVHCTACTNREECKIHGSNKFKCGHCRAFFSTQRQLLRHKKQIERPETRTRAQGRHSSLSKNQAQKKTIVNYRCDKCTEQFQSLQDTLRHRNIVHFKIRPHQCAFCSRKFSTRSNLESHLINCQRRKFFIEFNITPPSRSK